MSTLLGLANDFVEQMINPAAGLLVNNEYSLRLGDLLSDAEALGRLRAEIRELRRLDDVSARTWMWILSLPQSHLDLDPELLRQLCREFRGPAFRAAVLACVFRDGQPVPSVEELRLGHITSFENLDNDWLRVLVEDVLREPHTDQRDRDAGSVEPSEPSANDDAESLLVALLTVDSRECLEAGVALLRHPWSGQTGLRIFFESRTSAMDNESRALWLGLAQG
jgi:hypothetical protein